ncbi:MAG: hypothetical protein FWB73_01515 [Treponema sp.]|nr:hypothetical protein [Treponema sp.]
MKKKIIVAITMIAVLAGSVFAQGLPGDGFVSPQNTATIGRIRSNADDFMRPDSFHNVNFDSWYGFASFQSTLRATLGFATRFGKAPEDEEGKTGKKPVYLGLFYGGSAWANYEPISKREVDNITYFPAAASIALPTLSSANPYNQAAILLGIANMGFRLSFYSTYKAINQKDFTYVPLIDHDDDTTTPMIPGTPVNYKSYNTGIGVNSLQLGWSMSNNLTKVGIRPWVTFDLDFNNNFRKYQIFDATTAGNSTVVNSINFIQPIFQFGLGGITVANNKGWRTSVDLEYRMRLRFYDSEYSYAPASGGYTQIGKISGRNTNGALDEYFWMDHRIRPSVSTQWNGEKFRFRSKFDLNLELQSIDSAGRAINNGALISNGNDQNEFTFRLNPDLALAAQWQFAEKFFLNMGGRVNITALSLAAAKGTAYNNGTIVSDYKTTTTSFGAVGNELNLGFTINATNNLTIEANAGVGSDNVVSTFSTTRSATTGRLEGLLMFGGILLGLKF